MLNLYVPSSEEIAIVKLKHLFDINSIDKTTQEGLCAYLANQIYYFDYYYDYTDDITVWRKWNDLKKEIEEGISKVEDVYLRTELRKHFNRYDAGSVYNLFSWGKSGARITQYIKLRWSGETHERACDIVGLEKLVWELSDAAFNYKVYGRVLFSNDIVTANRVLKLSGIKTAMTPKGMTDKLRILTNVLAEGSIPVELFGTCLFDPEEHITKVGEHTLYQLKNFFILIVK